MCWPSPDPRPFAVARLAGPGLVHQGLHELRRLALAQSRGDGHGRAALGRLQAVAAARGLDLPAFADLGLVDLAR